MSWAEEELKYADLGDRRRNQRLIKRLLQNLESLS